MHKPSFFPSIEKIGYMDGGIKCSNNVLITYAPHRKFSEEMFGGFRNSSYLCSEKSVQLNILITYAPRKLL